MAAFKGFPPEALEFLRELEANNDRDWFKANRARYDEHLVAPVRALGEDLGRPSGAPHLFRPWNDTRFQPGPPIKEHVGLAVGYEGAGGYYVELSLDGLLVAAGLHRPAPDQLERIRRAIDDGRTAAPLTKAIGRARKAGWRSTSPSSSARRAATRPTTRGWTCCAASASRSRVATPSGRGCTARRQARRSARSSTAAAPLVRWVRERVGPSQRSYGGSD